MDYRADQVDAMYRSFILLKDHNLTVKNLVDYMNSLNDTTQGNSECIKIVVNECYGGFSISKPAMDDLRAMGVNAETYWNVGRTSPELINLIETKGSAYVSGDCAKLGVYSIPGTATDWTIQEYDGSEDILYVVDGKICYA